MRKNISVILVVLSLFVCIKIATIHRDNVSTKIERLIQDKMFFEARDIYNNEYSHLEDFHQYLYGVYINNVFNNLEKSNQEITELLSKYQSRLSSKQLREILSIEMQNSIKLFDYKKAVEISNIILTNHRDSLSIDEIKDYENTKLMFEPIIDLPKQEVVIYDYSDVIIKNDKLGFKNIPIETNIGNLDFVLDTGANISVVSRSMANRMGMNISENKFEVTSITGKKVNASIAFAPKLRISNIIISNAVFMVLDDESLAFSSLDYKINGIIGFPIISALGEIQLTKDNHFIVPKNTSYSSMHNLAINFLTPIIHLKTTDDYLDYSIDTGAKSSILYNNYYNRHKEDIEKAYTVKDIKFGGAGGSLAVKGYNIKFSPVINGKKIVLDSISVLTASLSEDNKLAGNIGQDLIYKYDKIIMNFKDMFVKFE